MSLSLILACIWALVANVLAMTPSRDHHWRNAYILVAVGIPILGYVVFNMAHGWGCWFWRVPVQYCVGPSSMWAAGCVALRAKHRLSNSI